MTVSGILTVLSALLTALPMILAFLEKRGVERKRRQDAFTKRSLDELDRGVGGMQPLSPEGLPPV